MRSVLFSNSSSILPLIVLILVAGIFQSAITTGSAGVHNPGVSPKMILSPTSTTLTLDGSAQDFCDHSTNSCQAMLTTTHHDDIIIAYTVEGLDLLPQCTFTMTDTSNLFWAARSAIVFDQTGRWQLQEFWARSPGNLTSDTLTESILGCASPQFGGEYNGLMSFGVSGANFTDPFDPNHSLPVLANGFSGGTSVLVSTSNSLDMIISGVLHGITTPLTAGTGFTLITGNPAGADAAEYQIVNRTLTSMPVAFGDNSTGGWMQIGDALQAGTASPSFAIYAQPSGITLSSPGSGSTTITLASLNGFAGTVNLTLSLPPPATSQSILPSSLVLSSGGLAKATLTITVANATIGFGIAVNAISGHTIHAIFVPVVARSVPPPSFAITAPVFLTVTQGQTIRAIVVVSGVNNFTGIVSLASTLNPNVVNTPSLSLNPTQVNLFLGSQGFSTLTVTTSQTTIVGAYNYTITGTATVPSGSLHVVFTGQLIVAAAPQPDFSLSAFPTSLTIIAGTSSSSGIEVFLNGPTLSSNFTVSLSAQVPGNTGVSASLNPPQVTIPPGTFQGFSTMTINTLSTTSPGNYSITVTSHAGPFSHTVQITVNVIPPPAIGLAPGSGPVGIKVLVQAKGFPVQFGEAQIEVSFDDQFVGVTFTSTGSFNFTFNVPVSQTGPHTIHATEQIFSGIQPITITAEAPFQVTSNPSNIAVSLDTGPIYFPGETVTLFAYVTVNGQASTVIDIQLKLQLILPNGTILNPALVLSGTGLYTAKYAVPAANSLGTYAAVVKAHSPTAGDASTIRTFEVKPTWLSTQGPTLAAGAALAGAIAVVGIAWQQGLFKRKRESQPVDWAAALNKS